MGLFDGGATLPAATHFNGGLDTGIELLAGQLLNISADENDLWNIWSGKDDQNADGLPAICSAGGSGTCGSEWIAHGLQTRVGALVGYIGGGDSFYVGTDFSQVITQTGRLFLHAFDGQWQDTSGFITVNVNVGQGVPTPAPLVLMLLGGLMLLASRRLRG